MSIYVAMSAVQWGTVGEWVGGLATAMGLAFAAYEIRASNTQRVQEEARRVEDQRLHREAMARSVSVHAVVDDVSDEQVAPKYPWADMEDLPQSSVWYRLNYVVHNDASGSPFVPDFGTVRPSSTR